MTDELQVFAIESSREYGERVCHELSIPRSRHEEREFEDGEHKIRPLQDVRDRDVYVIQSLYSDREQSVNDKLLRLLFFIGALKDAAARSVTAVIPYLGYARKDKRTKPNDPLSSRYVAQILEAVGVDRVVTIDVHNLAAYQNAFRIPVEHLAAQQLLCDSVVEILSRDDQLVVVAPDAGGIKRAEAFRALLDDQVENDVAFGLMEKTRSAGVLSAGRIHGDIADRTTLIVDDMISTGGTIELVARACRDARSRRVLALATHGLFISPADRILATDAIDQVVVSDTVPPFRLDTKVVETKLTVVSTAGVVAESIRRLHSGGSLVEFTGF